MSKYVVMFNVYTDSNGGTFYNLFPVAKIDDEYGTEKFLDPVFDGSASTREEISQLLLDRDRSVSLMCDGRDRAEAQKFIIDGSWAVMDLDQACNIARQYSTNSGIHMRLSFVECRVNGVFERLTDNGIALVKSDMEDENAALPYFLDDEYYNLLPTDEVEGPFDESTHEPNIGFGTFELLSPSQKLDNYVRYSISTSSPYEEHFYATFLFKDKLSVAKGAIPKELVQREKKIVSEPTVSTSLLMNAGALVPTDYVYGAYSATQSEPRASKPFTISVFKNEINASAYTTIEKFIFKSLSKMNAVTADGIAAQLKSSNTRTSAKPSLAIKNLFDLGYLKKHSVDGLGSFYSTTERSEKVYDSADGKRFLELKPNAVHDDRDIINASGAASRIAYANLLQNICENSEVTNNDRMGHHYSSAFIAKIDTKKNPTVFTGLFTSSPDGEEEYLADFEEILKSGNPATRLFVAGVNKEQALNYATFIKERMPDLVPYKIYAYALEGGSFYAEDTKVLVDDSIIWADDVIEKKVAIEPPVTPTEDSKDKKKSAKNKIDEEIKAAEQRKAIAEKEANDAEARKVSIQQQYEAINTQRESAQSEVIQLNEKIDSLKKLVKDTESRLKSKEFARIAVDGYYASQLMQAASDWENEAEGEQYAAYCDAVADLPAEELHGTLLSYINEKIKKVRPAYSDNEIINIAICIAQGFISVFSGQPGSGKTSICEIFARVLGLDQPVEGFSYQRYVPISVGRGWTSQRDFIGYYNPLSKEFDKSNQAAYDIFKIGDEERDGSEYPLMVLLDEANLSPMEYYWSEFIRVCDNLASERSINCGGKESFYIPDTLRFLATINNDDTTTTLSPRMIDRSWVITLPELNAKDWLKEAKDFEDGELVRIKWADFIDTFGPQEITAQMKNDVQKVVTAIVKEVPSLSINFRTYSSILNYYSCAQKLFAPQDLENGNYLPLDYAVAQRILPKIGGIDSQGTEYKTQLENLAKYFEEVHFEKCAKITRDIIKKGEAIGYYQFF